MKRILIVAAALVAGCGGSTPDDRPAAIDNAYLPLTKFTRCELNGGGERVVRTLLPQTRRFTLDGESVDARTIEDRAFVKGELVERTLDYFTERDDGTVLYLGEHVDNYENGEVVDHDGTWLLGRHTETPGVAMPPDPQVGDTWRFEDVPGVTIESNRVLRRLPSLRAGGRDYRDVIEVQERIQPDDEIELKYYARGTGVIREQPPDGRVELTGCS